MNKNQVVCENSQKNSTAVDSSASSNKTQSNGPFNASEYMAAASELNLETPIVNALIGNLTGTLPTKKSEATETVRCEICDCEISSSIIMNFHLSGARHKKKLKALEIISQLKAGGKNGVKLGDGDNPNNFKCEVCSLSVNSAQQLEFHLSGTKHQKNALKAGLIESNPESETNNKSKCDPQTQVQQETGQNFGENISGPPPSKIKKKEEPKTFPCFTCNITMNSEIQYKQHLTSKKHTGKSKLSKWTPLRKSFVPMKNGGNFQNSNSYPRYQNGTNPFNQNATQQYSNSIPNSNNNNINNNSNNFNKSFRNFNNIMKGSRFRPNLGNNGKPFWFGSNFPPQKQF